MNTSVSLVLLAYKEAENLKVLFPRIILNLNKLNIAYEIIVIDTRESLDNTKEVCDLFGAMYIPQEEDGYAGAFKTGIKYAKYGLLLVMDSDGSHPPETISCIYNHFTRGNFDIVIGSRYVKGGITNDSRISVIMSKVLNFVMKHVIGVRANDISTSFRLYNTELLKNIKLTRKNFDVLQEVILLMKLKKGSIAIGEVPIVFEKRLHGTSTRRLASYIVSYIGTVFVLLKTRFRKHGTHTTKSG